MASSPFGFVPGPMSGLRRSVVDPVTGHPVVTSAPTGEVRQRASLLPVGRDDSGALVPAVPQGIFDAIDAARFPGQVARGEKGVFDPATGHVSDEAMGAANGIAGLAMTGGLGGVSGGSVLGAGPARRTVLPMDQTSRMARAEAAGFSPQTFYHGTGANVSAFDPKLAGSATSYTDKNASKAIFFTDNPAVADSYVPGAYHLSSAPDVIQLSPDLGRSYRDGANVIPARLRGMDEFDVWDMGGAGYKDEFLHQAIAEARKSKTPGVIFENMKDAGPFKAGGPVGDGSRPSTVVAVLDPSRIRSPQAAFDPANAKKGTLLGSGSTDEAGAAAIGGAVLSSKAPTDPLAALELALADIKPEAPTSRARRLDPNAKSWDLYHGSEPGPDFERFDPTKSSNPAEQAVFFAPSAETAADYAGRPKAGSEAGSRVYRATVEPGKTGVFDLPHLAETDPTFNARARELTVRDSGAAHGQTFDSYMDGFQASRAQDRVVAAQAAEMGYDLGPDAASRLSYGHGHIGAVIERAREQGLDTAILRGLVEHGGDDQVVALTPGRVRSAYAPDQLLYSGGPAGALPAAVGTLSASPSNPQAPMTAGSPFGFGPLSQVAPEDIAALLRRTPLGPPQAFAGGGPAIAMDEAETQRLERGMGMTPDVAPAAPLPPRRPFGLTPPVQDAPADVPAAGAVPAAGQMPSPAAPAAQPAAASAEPSFGDRLANGLKGNGDLLIGLGTGLMSTHGLGNGLAAGLQLAQKSEKDRAVTDLARAEFGLKQRKLAQETGALAGNAAIIKRAFPNFSDTEATAAGSNAAQVAEAMKILRDPNHGTGAPTGYRIAASGGFEPIPGGEADPATIRTKAQAQAEGAAAGKPEDTVSLIPETERAQLGLPPGSYQRDSKGKISSVNPSGTTINMGGEKAYDAEVGKTYAKKFTDVQAAGTNAGAKLNTLALMEQAMRMPDFYSGVGGEGVKRANQFLSALGFKDAKAATGQEVFSALSNQAVLDQLGGTLGAGVSNTDRDYITTIGPGLEKTPEGNKQLIGIYRAVAQRQQRIAQMARDYAKANGGRIDAGFDDQVEQYANANPLFPTAQAGATARSDGVGMGAEAPRGAPEGTRMAPDGRFYAPDPGRPGKFLMVR